MDGTTIPVKSKSSDQNSSKKVRSKSEDKSKSKAVLSSDDEDDDDVGKVAKKSSKGNKCDTDDDVETFKLKPVHFRLTFTSILSRLLPFTCW